MKYEIIYDKGTIKFTSVMGTNVFKKGDKYYDKVLKPLQKAIEELNARSRLYDLFSEEYDNE